MTRKRGVLPISERPTPKGYAWEMEESFLLEAGIDSLNTEQTYRTSLRVFADWLQHFNKVGFNEEMDWPLDPAPLDTTTVLEFREWLMKHKSKSTVKTYTAAVISYVVFLDGRDRLPKSLQIGKLQRQLSRRRGERNAAESVIDLDIARQKIPLIVKYYDELPLPEENDRWNRRLSLLRDRAIVHTLYSTAARISELASLNLRTVDYGRSPHAMIVGKGNKTRTLHIREYARKSIQAYVAERKDQNGALFISHSNNSQRARLTIATIHNVIKKAVKALDLHESLSAHDFRHYRATSLLREGLPIEVVQEYLGHTSIATTRGIYAPVLGVGIVEEWLSNFDVDPHSAASAKEEEEQLNNPISHPQTLAILNDAL